MKMFSNNLNNNSNNPNNSNINTIIPNNLNEFDNELVVHKTGHCNSANSILASATASISTHSQTSRSSPAVNQHRISIQVKVEENSASSTEDNSGDCSGTVANISANNVGNNWPNACIYKCNISADSRRYIYSEDKCLEPELETKNLENETNHLIALRDQFLCSGSAFSTNTQQNSQHYSLSDNFGSHCSSKLNSLREDGLIISNTIRSNSLQDSVINTQNIDEKRLSFTSELDPIYWNWEQVRQWLELTVKDYSLHDIDINRFTHFVGKDLCRMTREDFKKLTDSNNGELLFAQFQILRQSYLSLYKEKQSQSSIGTLTTLTSPYPNKSYSQNIIHNSSNSVQNFRHPKSETSYKGAWGSPSPSPSQGYHHNAISSMTKPSALDPHSHSHLRNMQDPYQMFGPTSSRLASSGSGQIQLWQFLLELLSDSGNANCITWEGTNGEFKLTDPDEVARRWGERKSKPNMNYDKLSRALRYYYDKNIMTKVHGKRYAYKFDFQGLAQATQPTAADPSAYKAAYQSADLFMHPPPGYPHPGSKHLNFAAAVHGAGIPSTSGSIFPSASSYWTSPTAANLYSNIAAASATHHSMAPHHHHPSHMTSHIGSYAHYA